MKTAPRTDWTIRDTPPRRRDGLMAVIIAVLIAALLSGIVWVVVDYTNQGQQSNRNKIVMTDRKAAQTQVQFNGALRCLQRTDRNAVNRCLGKQAIPGATTASAVRGSGGRGLPGAKGNDGRDGVGTPGRNGTNGAPGASVKGDTGAKGESVKGDTGAKGESVKGDTGAKGESVKGENGKDGAPGPGPTDAQIQAAVEAFCAARNNCTPVAPSPLP